VWYISNYFNRVQDSIVVTAKLADMARIVVSVTKRSDMAVNVTLSGSRIRSNRICGTDLAVILYGMY
jgi:hypothetical protein